MLTERQKNMIDAYLPHQRDKSLGLGEYYARDVRGRVYKVFISELNPSMREDCTLYGVRYDMSGKRFNSGFGYGCTHKCELYDNYKDCLDQTHPCYDWWEELRREQERDGYEGSAS